MNPSLYNEAARDSTAEDASRASRYFVLAAAFLLSFLLLSWIQFSSPSLVDFDGYYHIKIADLIRKHGLPTDFPWLPYTLLDESRFTDHHLLFHLLQAPFTWLLELRFAAKVSAVCFAAFTFTFLTWLLMRYRVRYPVAWLILLFASSSPFLYRMSMPRAQSLSLLLQALAFHLILQKRYMHLLLLSVVFVWMYNAFPTIAALAGIGFVAERICAKRWDFRLLLYPAAGMCIGLVANPYFPNNIYFLWSHIGPKIFAGSFKTSVGSEWYPYQTWSLVRHSLPALMCYGATLLLTNRRELVRDKTRLFWILTASFYFLLLLKSRRFIEYFPPAAVLALAFTLRQFLRKKRFAWKLGAKPELAAPAVLALLIAFVSFTTINAARNDVRDSMAWDSYRGAALWLAENTPEKSVVFHADWDDFPMLFYFNTHNRYIVGLDADFMRLRNEPLYRKYEEITQGDIQQPIPYICNVFRSSFVFTDDRHEELIENLENSGQASLVYSDDHTRIFELSCP